MPSAAQWPTPPAALAVALTIADYRPGPRGLELRIAVPIGGNPNRVAWSTQYERLGALEASQTKMMADTKYLDMVAKGADNFIAGSVNDQMWRIL